MLQWGAMPLEDNLPTDNYHYQVAVYTGVRKNAGTDSRIRFIMSGDEADTGVRRLYDGKRKVRMNKMRYCVCPCVCASVRVYVCVCVCVLSLIHI